MQIFTQICSIFYSNSVKYLLKTYFFLLRCQSLPTEALYISRKLVYSLSE